MAPLPTLAGLYSLFPSATVPRCEPIPAEALPEPYRELLAHTDHMTVTVERFYGEAVSVAVLESQRKGNLYSRRIVLSTSNSVVQFGIVEIDLSVLPANVVSEILAGHVPLGRVLIQNGVLTRVQSAGYLRIEADDGLARVFSIPPGTVLYGRLGVIFAGDAPAIEVLEVLAPVAVDA